MGKWIGWGLAGLAAIAAAILVSRSSSAASATDLCLAKLPEPFKTQAADIIKVGDLARMRSFAAQCDAKGWHCAGKELRGVAKKMVCDAGRKAGEAAGTGDIGNFSYPHKQSVRYSDDKDDQKEFDRCFYEGYQAKWTKGVAAAGCPDAALVTSIVAQISLGTMSTAEAEKLDADYRARFMLGTPDYAKCGPLPVSWDGIRVAIAEKKYVPPTGVTTAPPTGVTTAPPTIFPMDPLDSLPPIVRTAVDAAYASVDAQQLDDVAADYLVPYPDAWKKVKADAAEMRDRATKPLSAIPGDTGSKTALMLVSVSEELGAPWLLSYPQYIWSTVTPYVTFDGSASGWNVSNAFLARGYKQAAIDTAALWGM